MPGAHPRWDQPTSSPCAAQSPPPPVLPEKGLWKSPPARLEPVLRGAGRGGHPGKDQTAPERRSERKP